MSIWCSQQVSACGQGSFPGSLVCWRPPAGMDTETLGAIADVNFSSGLAWMVSTSKNRAGRQT